MSKFRALLGSLAAVGILAVFGAGAILSVYSTSAHAAPRFESAVATSACFACVEAADVATS
jgi:hypothetical protein